MRLGHLPSVGPVHAHTSMSGRLACVAVRRPATFAASLAEMMRIARTQGVRDPRPLFERPHPADTPHSPGKHKHHGLSGTVASSKGAARALAATRAGTPGRSCKARRRNTEDGPRLLWLREPIQDLLSDRTQLLPPQDIAEAHERDIVR
jgi:hypothetical protein